MPEERTATIFITFLAAIIGYAGMTGVILLSGNGKIPFVILRITASVILLHVILVWTYRYSWQFSVSVRNGYTGFIIFHSALLMILLSTFIKEHIACILIRISFLMVTVGAVGAVLMYDAVTIYRIPVFILALVGCISLIRVYTFKKHIRLKA